MKRHNNSIILLYLSLPLIFSCNPRIKNEKPEFNIEIPEKSLIKVETMVLKHSSFSKELVSNGKIVSERRADLNFPIEGIVESILVKEGQSVRKGDVIATLNEEELEVVLKQHELEKESAILEYEDHLLRLGYKMTDTASLDSRIKEIGQLKSGLSLALVNIEKTQIQLANTRLTAPFSGKIANLKGKPNSRTTSSEYICSLIDNNNIYAEFKVLEQELLFLSKTKEVKISPYSLPDKSFEGIVSTVNPMVDEAGMITIKARISNSVNLLDGMSVQVILNNKINNQLAIPKEAVLDRQNKRVVFTHIDGLAKWNYVEISNENSDSYTISKGLNPGDEIIYKGNFNLAHNSEVQKSY